ncbi:MAG TPA: diacylglycerol kinase family protein [Tepidisphaeraceae bacterium]|nr:diacylglycerol kinase family protein [Tepidisphaeraceae bacterium]
MSETILIFANPIAGRGRGRVVARRLERELTAAGYSAITILDRPADVKLSAEHRAATAAISIGGDGTLRGVVELLMAADGNAPPLLPVPMGTANLMGRHLGMKWSAWNLGTSVLATLRRREIIQIDAARANGKLFLLMAGVGIDAQVVHLLDQMRRGPIDFTSYVLPAAMTFANYDFPAITVNVDGQTVARDTPAIAVIGNVKEYGTGFPILTEARPDDGLLDICVMPCRDRRALAEILMLVATGEHPLREDVVYLKGKSVRVESTTPVAVQIDGDSAGYTPLQIDLLAQRVPFLVPA